MIFEWDQACQMIFDHMKKWMTEVSILRYFDQNRKTILETDSLSESCLDDTINEDQNW